MHKQSILYLHDWSFENRHYGRLQGSSHCLIFEVTGNQLNSKTFKKYNEVETVFVRFIDYPIQNGLIMGTFCAS